MSSNKQNTVYNSAQCCPGLIIMAEMAETRAMAYEFKDKILLPACDLLDQNGTRKGEEDSLKTNYDEEYCDDTSSSSSSTCLLPITISEVSANIENDLSALKRVWTKKSDPCKSKQEPHTEPIVPNAFINVENNISSSAKKSNNDVNETDPIIHLKNYPKPILTNKMLEQRANIYNIEQYSASYTHCTNGDETATEEPKKRELTNNDQIKKLLGVPTLPVDIKAQSKTNAETPTEMMSSDVRFAYSSTSDSIVIGLDVALKCMQKRLDDKNERKINSTGKDEQKELKTKDSLDKEPSTSRNRPEKDSFSNTLARNNARCTKPAQI